MEYKVIEAGNIIELARLINQEHGFEPVGGVAVTHYVLENSRKGYEEEYWLYSQALVKSKGQQATMLEFKTVKEAYEWMETEVDDPCIDNRRFCFLNVGEQVAEFEMVASQGCCGSFEKDVLISGIPARIGCNYGH